MRYLEKNKKNWVNNCKTKKRGISVSIHVCTEILLETSQHRSKFNCFLSNNQ